MRYVAVKFFIVCLTFLCVVGEEPEEAKARAADQVKKRELTELSKNGPERFMGWVWPLVRMSKLEVAEKCGNDAMIYIHFQRCMLAFLAICVVLGIGILLPVNVTANQREDKVRSGFLSTTIGTCRSPPPPTQHIAMLTVAVDQVTSTTAPTRTDTGRTPLCVSSSPAWCMASCGTFANTSSRARYVGDEHI